MWQCKGFLWTLLFFIGSAGAFAASVESVPFDEFVKKTEMIVRGTAGHQYTKWVEGPDGVERIYTFTEFQIDEVLRGQVPKQNQVFIRSLGGELDGTRMDIPGEVSFQKGEEAVLFIETQEADGSFLPRGMAQGKLNIYKDIETGEEMVRGGILGAPRPLRAFREMIPVEETADFVATSNDLSESRKTSIAERKDPGAVEDLKKESMLDWWKWGVAALLLAGVLFWRRQKR